MQAYLYHIKMFIASLNCKGYKKKSFLCTFTGRSEPVKDVAKISTNKLSTFDY